MSKTADLRKLIVEKLVAVIPRVYYRRAPNNAGMPYATFELQRANLGDLARDDLDLCVDLWDNARSPKAVDGLADKIEAVFHAANLPQDRILPTFYRESRYPVDDPDKDYQHLQLHFQVQLYENI